MKPFATALSALLFAAFVLPAHAENKKSLPEAAAPAAAKAAAIENKAPVKDAVKISGPKNYVGEIATYKAAEDDTMLTIGERENLGYVELRSANPAMDPWRPGSGTFMILPKMHLLPDAPRKGIVVNLSEMRLYYYNKNGNIQSYPIGVGREGFSTPMGTTTVVSKTKDPTWRPTDRMLREDPTLKPFYGPGPDNPLGNYALYLGWPQYRLHGTNKPWGIGRRVSSGCIRMYNTAAEDLFRTVPVGTPVAVVRQPIKFAWIGDMLYLEAHPDGALADQVERAGGSDYKVPSDIFANLSRAAGKARDRIDWQRVREALKDRRGYPVPILANPTEDQFFVTEAMTERAGTSRFGPRLTQSPLEPLVPGMTTLEQPAAAEQTAAPARRRAAGFNG
jgi:L,D-transpeptidase ErfK/SrfK